VLGEEHPDTLTSINNLASCLNSQSKHSEAEPLYRQALAARQKVCHHALCLSASLPGLISAATDQMSAPE